MATLSPRQKTVALDYGATRGSLHAHARSNKLISGEKCDLPVAKMHKPYCTLQIFTP